MNTKKVFTVVSVSLFLLSSCMSSSQPQGNSVSTGNDVVVSNGMNNDFIIFYGDGCPHCENIEKFVKDNNIDSSTFNLKEVYHNKANAQMLQDKAKECGMDAGSVGVPMLWNHGKCLVGDKDIIDFFKVKYSIK